MSVFKNTFSRALVPLFSNTIDIPTPQSLNISSTNTTATAGKLIDSTQGFITKNVYVGDIVYNTSLQALATVLSIDSQTQLTLSSDIFSGTGNAYQLYSMSAQAGIGNEGCYLYVGSAGNVAITTVGGDVVTFNNVPTGSILPIQVRRLMSTGTTATNLMALW